MQLLWESDCRMRCRLKRSHPLNDHRILGVLALLMLTFTCVRACVASVAHRGRHCSGVELGVKQGMYTISVLSRWRRCSEYVQVDAWQPLENYVDTSNVAADEQVKNKQLAAEHLESMVRINASVPGPSLSLSLARALSTRTRIYAHAQSGRPSTQPTQRACATSAIACPLALTGAALVRKRASDVLARLILRGWWQVKKGYARRGVQCQNFTTVCARNYPDQYFDFIYVDARHDRLGVLEDLAAWWPKLRPGGVIAGHDYTLQTEPRGPYHLKEEGDPTDTKQNWTLNYDGTVDRSGRVVRGAVDDFFQGIAPAGHAAMAQLAACPLQVVVTYREPAWNTWMVAKPWPAHASSTPTPSALPTPPALTNGEFHLPACPKSKGGSKEAQSATQALGLVALHGSGTALVIGANTGSVLNDPSFAVLASGPFANFDKLFVEPMPTLFHTLEENIKGMPRARAVNHAIANQSKTLDMYCLGSLKGRALEAVTRGKGKGKGDRGLGAVARGKGHGAGKPKGTDDAQWWWSQICSLSRERLFSSYDVMAHPSKGGGSHDPTQEADRLRKKYEAIVTTTQVSKRGPWTTSNCTALPLAHARMRVRMQWLCAPALLRQVRLSARARGTWPFGASMLCAAHICIATTRNTCVSSIGPSNYGAAVARELRHLTRALRADRR